MYCERCHALLIENARFCHSCGKHLSDGKVFQNEHEPFLEKIKNILDSSGYEIQDLDTDKGALLCRLPSSSMSMMVRHWPSYIVFTRFVPVAINLDVKDVGILGALNVANNISSLCTTSLAEDGKFLFIKTVVRTNPRMDLFSFSEILDEFRDNALRVLMESELKAFCRAEDIAAELKNINRKYGKRQT